MTDEMVEGRPVHFARSERLRPFVYVASSWENPEHDEVVAALKAAELDVYDYRRSGAGGAGFTWDLLDDRWRDWSVERYREALARPAARAAFEADRTALVAADALVLILPSGRSAHLELGYAISRGAPCFVLMRPEPGIFDLMYAFKGVQIVTGIDELVAKVRVVDTGDLVDQPLRNYFRACAAEAAGWAP